MVGLGTLTPVMLVRIQTPEPDPFRDRLMVGQQTLNLHIEVRILAPEPAESLFGIRPTAGQRSLKPLIGVRISYPEPVTVVTFIAV